MSDLVDGEEERFRPRPVPPRQRPGGTRAPRPRPGAPTPSGSWPSWLPWVAVLLLIAVAVLPRLAERSSAERVTYSELIDLARTSKLRSAEADNVSGRITAVLIDGRRVTTVGRTPLPETDAATLATNAQLSYRTSRPTRWNGLTEVAALAAVLLSAWLLLGRRRPSEFSSASGIGRSRAKVWTTERPTTTFSDVAGYENTKAEITEVIGFLTNPGRFQAMGARIPKGILLVGPPGTGKTLIARAVAGEAGVPFFTVTGSDFMEMFVGVGAARVRDLFDQARRVAPCIVFMDEIDSIGRKRGAGLGGGHDEREQTLNQLLSEMDGFEDTSGVVILAATNRPDILDAALLRPGRFDRQVVVPLPELDERLAILRVHMASKPSADDVDLDEVARSTPGMSGAELANLVNEAALAAVRRSSAVVSRGDLDVARDRVLLGVRRDSMVLTEGEREATAFHEAGHALLAHVLAHADPLHKVSIIPRGMALGVTMQLPDEDRHTATEPEIRDRIAVAMGGRAAEQLVYGTVSTGATDDLMRSTELARRMVREWGMSDRIGPMAWGANAQVFLGEDLVQSRDCADETMRIVDIEVERILREEERRALTELRTRRQSLELIANALLDRETITGADVERMLSPGPVHRPTAART